MDSAAGWLREARALSPRAADWRLVSNGPAADVADALGLDPSQHVELSGADESPLALGAIRFAGMRPNVDQPMLGATAEAVWSDGVCPSPVGLVGVNREGKRYWSRLFGPGTALPTSPDALVQSSGEGPRYRDDILMAECVHPAFWQHSWISQDDWEAAGIRLHEMARATPRKIVRPNLDPNLHAWSFTLRQRDRQEPWGYPRWSIYYQPPRSS
ncbi:MAG: hypothetical protein U0835_17080 [Isosphaeraceae bacterium]